MCLETMLVREEDVERFLKLGWCLSKHGGYTHHHGHLAVLIVREVAE